MFAKKKKPTISFIAAVSSMMLISVATASAAHTLTISNVVVEQSGTQFDISKAEFNAALPFQIVKTTEIKYFKLENKYYSKAILNAVLGTGLTFDKALDYLVKSDRNESINPAIGKIEKGKLVSDTKPNVAFEIISIE